MRRFIGFALFVLLAHADAVIADPAAKQNGSGPVREATRDGVESAIGKGSSPIAPADVKAMGKDADLVLIDIIRDQKATPTLRGRAIDALAATSTAVARDHLVRIALPTASEADLPLVRKALLGLGWMQDARIVDHAGPWLEHKSAQVRLDAAVALSLAKHPDGIELLERHNRSEKDADVRRQIAQLVKQYRDSQPKAAPKVAPKPRILPPPPMEGRDSPRL